MTATVNDVDDDVKGRPHRPEPTDRKSSFSETLNKFANNAFPRRRTVTNLPNAETSNNIFQTSRLPTLAGIPRSTSFFSSLNVFSKDKLSDKDVDASCPAKTKHSRRISDRLASTPFFKQQQYYDNTNAVLDSPKPKERRESGVQIKHHGLMQPINAPLPRSSTMGNLGKTTSTPMPNFMRPTTSSAARRESCVVQQSQKDTPPFVSRAKMRLSSLSEKSGIDTSTPAKQRTSSILDSSIMEDSSILDSSGNRARTPPRLIMQENGRMVSTPIKLPGTPHSPNITKDHEEEVLAWREGVKGVGGFSLVCGKPGRPLAVVSNRTPSVEGVTWIAKKKGETVGLSNAAFGDRSWPKVLKGEELMSSVIAKSCGPNESKAELIEELLRVLSVDTLPRRQEGQAWTSYVKELRNSIFIPAIGGEGMDGVSAYNVAAAKTSQQVQVNTQEDKPMNREGLSGKYGTQKQTVVLVDHQGRMTFVERTVYDADGREIADKERDRMFEFDIEGWQS